MSTVLASPAISTAEDGTTLVSYQLIRLHLFAGAVALLVSMAAGFEYSLQFIGYYPFDGEWLAPGHMRLIHTNTAAYGRLVKDPPEHFLELPGVRLPLEVDSAHLFAWGYQVRRGFEGTFRGIHGGSMPAARLRAAVWQSIFTHDMNRYGRSLHRSMGDVTTLILGESGTGKELVARAIGMSRYIPFDPGSQRFRQDYTGAFHAVSLSALSLTLIESELFGHRRGAFTGALEDREGWLEVCSELGTVFLDEIGELAPLIQVKLLRVLQARTFQRVGETRDRRFRGKLIAATNRDLPDEIASSRFRFVE